MAFSWNNPDFVKGINFVITFKMVQIEWQIVGDGKKLLFRYFSQFFTIGTYVGVQKWLFLGFLTFFVVLTSFISFKEWICILSVGKKLQRESFVCSKLSICIFYSAFSMILLWLDVIISSIKYEEVVFEKCFKLAI
jgi:hypothetical protein